MARRRSAKSVTTADYRHDERRTNIPPAKIAAEGIVPKVPPAEYRYSPHLDPVLRFDSTGKADALPELIAAAGHRTLTPAEQRLLAEALRDKQPWLEWSTKQEQHEQDVLRVDPVALHIHERVSTQAILKVATREEVQRDLFADPQQPYHEAVQFYRHEMDWANRLILGDSLQVMSSLAKRESMAGKIQMIFFDPPYGIRFSSNFQPEIGQRDVKDRDDDLSREAEMVRAFRDTWRLGVHSYLAYLRDRLLIARELLAESGSIFVQISDENVHRVRAVLDDVFGSRNAVITISFVKTAGQTSAGLSRVADYLLWYAKDASKVKIRSLHRLKEAGSETAGEYRSVMLPDGQSASLPGDAVAMDAIVNQGGRVYRPQPIVSQGYRPNTSVPFTFEGQTFETGNSLNWKTTLEGMARLAGAGRLMARRTSVAYIRYIDDFPVLPLNNVWQDTGIAGRRGEKQYVVQTSPKVLRRCILMSTDPGDVVLDPTCGGGTTALVAERWGRRWITIDTSRVAVAIARQRLLTARMEAFRTVDGSAVPARGLVYKCVPHITLRSIAHNTHLDALFAQHQPILDACLADCNDALGEVEDPTRIRLAGKLKDKTVRAGKRAVTDADERRWNLPKEAFEHWTVPFDTDPDWPASLAKAVTAYRKAWRAKMDAVDACIAANSDQEQLVDQPEVVPGVVRVSGPFTVEGVKPAELSLDEAGLFGGAPEGDLSETDNLTAYLIRMVDLLRSDGVRFPDNKHRTFTRVEPLFESSGNRLHAEARWADDEDDGSNDVAIGFGPQYGPVTAAQVENLIRDSRRYRHLVVAGFSFDAAASAIIQESNHPRLTIHQAFIRPDVNPAMDGLLKEKPGDQLFTVFGQPDVELRKVSGGEYEVELQGVDIYDPISGTVRSTGASKVAAWFLDADYDGRCFCITQAFFPNQNAWDKIAKALKSKADPEAFDKLAGTVSLPFPPGKHRQVAVKVIDPRGNEVMTIRSLD